MENIIEINDLRKSYKNMEAVKGINLSVKEGCFFAFLGENGAGKSTTINIIATLIKKTSGDVRINQHMLDKDDQLIRNDIGVVFQENMLDKHLTVRENIHNRGCLYGLPKKLIEERMLELSESIGITEFLDKRYGRLSGGQRRRADIVRSLIQKPRILIMDEPTTGLDPYARKCVWEVIRRLNEEKKLTIFLTTHYMEEAACADYVVIIDSGEIKAAGTPEQLRRSYSRDRLVLTLNSRDTDLTIIEELGYPYQQNSEIITIGINQSFEALDIIEKLRASIDSFEVVKGNMDDVFLNITSKEGKKNNE